MLLKDKNQFHCSAGTILRDVKTKVTRRGHDHGSSVTSLRKNNNESLDNCEEMRS